MPVFNWQICRQKSFCCTRECAATYVYSMQSTTLISALICCSSSWQPLRLSVCLSDSPSVWQFVRAWCWILSEASSFIYACHSSDALMRARIHDAAGEHWRARGRCVQGTSWQRRQHLAGKTAQRSVTALDAFVWLAVLITRQRQNISSIRRVVCGARRMFHNVALTVSVTVPAPAPAPAPVPVPAPAWRLVRPQSEMAEMLLHTKRTLWPHVALFAAGNEPSTHFALQIAIN